MNETEAYAVLHVAPGSSQEEIKEAYATLSKTYHPEEYPDEFQQIHEAYSVLRRRNRGQGSRKTEHEENGDLSVYNETHMEQTESRNVSVEEDQEDVSGEQYDQEDVSGEQYDFEDVIEESDREDEQRLIYLIQKALVEMEMLLQPQYCNKLKLFQQFFQKPEYQNAVKQPVFMGYFADLLADSNLKPAIYDCIIEAYRFRGLNPKEMYEDAAKLYYVLDEKRGMHPKKGGAWKATVLAGIVAGIRAGTRSTTEGTTAGDFFSLLAIAVIIIALLVFGYRQLYKNHSSLFAQAIVSLVLTISQFIILMGDFYAPLMGTGNGTMLSVFLFLAGGVWLIGVGIAAIIKKIKRLSGR